MTRLYGCAAAYLDGIVDEVFDGKSLYEAPRDGCREEGM